MPPVIKKGLLIGSGSLFLAIGTIGIFLPLLPTTPFLLLSAACYIKSSKRLYNWLIHHEIFGIYIYNYITYKAIGIHAKIFSITLLWITLTLSMILVSTMVVTGILCLIGIAVSIHLLRLKTLSKEEMILNKRSMSKI
jgi:uncharacterized membrane protein YbaN (DUF454 family)